MSYLVLHTAMTVQVRKGDLDKIKQSIAKGVDLHYVGPLGDTFLHYAALEGQVETIRFLVEQGCRVDAKNDHGKTALHHAATVGHVHCVNLLIGLGADVDIKNKHGETPWIAAINAGELEVDAYFKSKSEREQLDGLIGKFEQGRGLEF